MAPRRVLYQARGTGRHQKRGINRHETRSKNLRMSRGSGPDGPVHELLRTGDGEWVSLFDGTTLSGWTKGGRKASKWEVEDGSIVGSGRSSMLYSPKGDYKNFRFRAEVKINDHGNSGMYFRCPTTDGDFSKGYEAQIDSTHRDPIRTGSLYGFIHVYKQLVPPDTWFTYEIEVVDQGLARQRDAPHQGLGQRRSAVRVPRSHARRGTRAISPSSSTIRAARSRSARSRSGDLDEKVWYSRRPSRPPRAAAGWLGPPRPAASIAAHSQERRNAPTVITATDTHRETSNDGQPVGRKSISELKAEAAESHEHSLKRTLTATNLVMLGIGAVMAPGFSCLTGHAAAENAGPGDLALVRPGGNRPAFAGLCYAEMASTVPIAGSAYTYAYATMGEFIAWLIGWDLILEYMVGATTVAIGWSGYVTSFLHDLGIDIPAQFTPSPGTRLIEVPNAIAEKLHMRHGWSILEFGARAVDQEPDRFFQLSPGHGGHQCSGDDHRRPGHGAAGGRHPGVGQGQQRDRRNQGDDRRPVHSHRPAAW